MAVNEVYLPHLYLLLHHQVRSDWEAGMGEWWAIFLRVKSGLLTRCLYGGPQIPPGGKGWVYPASSDFSLKLQVKRKPCIFRLGVSK